MSRWHRSISRFLRNAGFRPTSSSCNESSSHLPWRRPGSARAICRTAGLVCIGLAPAFAEAMHELLENKNMTTDPDQRPAQSRTPLHHRRAYRHHQLRRAPDHRCDGQDELHQPRSRARDRHLQPDAGRQGLLDLPRHRRVDHRGRLHGSVCRAAAQQHGRRHRRHRRDHRRHGFLRRAWPQALSGARSAR